MNALYKVTLADDIKTAFDFDKTVVKVLAPDNDFVIDARQSAYSLTGKNEGLVYNWSCEGTLQEYCNRWNGVPLLHISMSDIDEFWKENAFTEISV